MMRMRGWKFVLSVPVLLLALVPVQAAPVKAVSPLTQVPAQSPIVVYLHGGERTKDRVVALMKNALPDLAPLVEGKLNEWLKKGIEGRKLLEGVPADGAIFFVMMEMPKPGMRGEPKMAFIIQVKDYTAFRDGLLKEQERKEIKGNGRGVEMVKMDFTDTYFVDRRGWAVVTPNEEAANDFAKNYRGLDTTINAAVASRLLKADGAVFVNVASIVKTYGDQLKASQEEIEKKLTEQIEKTEDPQQKAGMEISKTTFGLLFQLLHDTNVGLATVELRPTALVLHKEVTFKPGSLTSTVLKTMKLSPFKTLDRLPAGDLIYLGMDSSSALYKFAGSMTASLVGGAQGKEVKEAMEELGQAGAGFRVDAVSLPPSGLDVWECKDPVKATAAQLKLLKAMAKSDALLKSSIAKKPVITENAQTYEDFKLTRVQMGWDYDKLKEIGGGNLPESIQKTLTTVLPVLLGSETNYWFGTDGKVFIQVTAKDWASAKKILDRYFKGEKSIGATAGYRAIRKELPAEASFLVLIDTSKTANLVLKVIKPLLKDKDVPAPNMKASGTFLGIALSFQAQRASSDVVLPAASVKAVYDTAVKPLLMPR